jgi:hypothetical protein
LILGLLLATILPAQRNELALQFGTTLTQRRSLSVPRQFQPFVPADVIREDNGYAGGIVYRVRLVRLGSAAALMAEIPLFAVQAITSDFLPQSTSGATAFLTPGAVIRFLPDARVSPYAFFGAGYARVVEARLTSISPIRGSFANEGTWAIGYGGGADLRLGPVVAIRGEVRNFQAGYTDDLNLPEQVRQRNTLLVTGGLVFRF